MEKRSVQIDVVALNEEIRYTDMVRCNIYLGGRCCTFWTTQSNYEALIYDGIFIRDGKAKDSANILNTTNVFYEEIKK